MLGCDEHLGDGQNRTTVLSNIQDGLAVDVVMERNGPLDLLILTHLLEDGLCPLNFFAFSVGVQ